MKTEKVLSIVFIISLIFKLMHWPGGSPLMVLSLLGTVDVYFIEDDKDTAYQQDIKKLRESVLYKVTEIIDQVIIDNESKVG